MHQWVLAGSGRVGMVEQIGAAGEQRVRIGPVPRTLKEMNQSGNACLAGLRAVMKVVRRVERRMRFTPFRCAMQNIVQQRIYADFADVRIPLQIISGVEQRVRLEVAGGPVFQIVKQRVIPTFKNFRVLGCIKDRIEQRVRIAPFKTAPEDEMQQWAHASRNIRVRRLIVIRIEEDGCRAPSAP